MNAKQGGEVTGHRRLTDDVRPENVVPWMEII
jgi:hypothetical protein